MPEVSPAVRAFILGFADDEHLMGQCHTEWIGVAPFLEEDLAFASIGQDELGHAASLYGLLVGTDDEAIDRLAFRRPAEQYRSCWLVEYQTNDWAETLVRHWFYDAAEQLRWNLVAGSTVTGLAGLVDRASREESYHRRHADGLLDVLLEAHESRRRIERAAKELWPVALGLFDADPGEVTLLADGVISEPWSKQVVPWQELVEQRFPGIDWSTVDGGSCLQDQAGRTVRHQDFEALYGRMREVMKFDPEAVW